MVALHFIRAFEVVFDAANSRVVSAVSRPTFGKFNLHKFTRPSRFVAKPMKRQLPAIEKF